MTFSAHSNKKRLAIYIVLLVIFVTLGTGYYKYFGNPFLTTDATSPSFRASNFRFENYIHDMRTPFAALFPPGTPKSKVDELLVKYGGATFEWERNNRPDAPLKYAHYRYGSLIYAFEPKNNVFIFNSQDEVVNVHPEGGAPLF